MTYKELLQELTRQMVVENGPAPRAPRVVIGGMGGSALPANAARFLDATLSLSTHRDYDLPEAVDPDALHIAISDSGNTAETLSFATLAKERGFPLAVITSGGELLEFARASGVPCIEVPGDVQPRNALFYLLRSLLTLLGREELLAELASVEFNNADAEKDAATLAAALREALPLFYASRKNGFLAYVSKIHFNETAKMPAYANIFPELNHNEMQSLDTPAPAGVAALARMVIVRDEEDDPRVTRRMDVFAELMRERGRSVTELALSGTTRAEKLARAWFTMHLAARALAEARGVDPDTVPLVEDFKKRL